MLYENGGLVPIEAAYLNDVKLGASNLAQIARELIPNNLHFQLFIALLAFEELKFRIENPKPFEDITDILLTMTDATHKYHNILTAEKNGLIQEVIEQSPVDPNNAYKILGDLRIMAAELRRAKGNKVKVSEFLQKWEGQKSTQ